MVSSEKLALPLSLALVPTLKVEADFLWRIQKNIGMKIEWCFGQKTLLYYCLWLEINWTLFDFGLFIGQARKVYKILSQML